MMVVIMVGMEQYRDGDVIVMVMMMVVMIPCNKMMIMVSGHFPTHPPSEQHHSVFCDSGDEDEDEDEDDGGDDRWYGIVE